MGSNRLSELAKKSLAGTLTDVEKAEMTGLVDSPETMKKSVTSSEFEAFADAELAAFTVKMDPFRAELLKKNTKAMLTSVAKDKDAKFDIEVVKDSPKVDSSTQYAGIMDGLTKIQASIESLAKSLVKSEPAAPPVASADSPAVPPVVVETKAAPTVCAECGAEMAGATTCPKCGWKYDAAAEAKAKEEKAAKDAAAELEKRSNVFPLDYGEAEVRKVALAKAEKDKAKGK